MLQTMMNSRIVCCSRLITRCSLSRFTAVRLPFNRNNINPIADVRNFSTQDKKDRKKKWPFHISMTSEQREAKEKRIEEMKKEEPPSSLFAKVKYYFKRYWYIAIPAHTVSCTAWFVGLYFLVKSGVDVIALLQTLHMPDYIVQKVQNTPPSAGVFVVALILYKIVIPLRYATTLVLIQASFWTLRRMGKLKTAREVEYKVRSEYEKQKTYYGRRLYKYRKLGVRDASRKQSQSRQLQAKSEGPPSEKKS